MAVDLEVLREAVREAAAPLLAAGWEPEADWAAGEPDCAGAWRLALADDFTVRVALWCGAGPPGSGGDAADGAGGAFDASVRLSFDPAERAGAALGVRGCGGVTVGVAELTGAGPDAAQTSVVGTAGEARAAAEETVSAVTGHAASWARPLASVDALLQRIIADLPSSRPGLREVVYLGAAGRVQLAREALVAWLEASRSERWRPSGQVADVARWLAEGAGAPAASDRWHRGPGMVSGSVPPPDFGAAWRRVRQLTAAKRATREVGGDRGALRERYLAELAERDLRETPASVEAFLDGLEMTGAERWQAGLEGVRAIGAAGSGIVRALRGARDSRAPRRLDPTLRVGPIVDLAGDGVPERWRLPVRAAFPARHRRPGADPGSRSLPVELGAGADAVVDAVVAEPSHLPKSTSLPGWLARAGSGDVGVHVGEERIGSLDASAAARFEEDMGLAATLGLDVVVRLRLIRRRRPPLHLAEVEADG